jgi:hypothetical protein
VASTLLFVESPWLTVGAPVVFCTGLSVVDSDSVFPLLDSDSVFPLYPVACVVIGLSVVVDPLTVIGLSVVDPLNPLSEVVIGLSVVDPLIDPLSEEIIGLAVVIDPLLEK